MVFPKDCPKTHIQLSVVDPTVAGNIPPSKITEPAINESVASQKWNGYPHSAGYIEARDAVARKFTRETAPLEATDVILGSGCSHCLEMSLSCLLNPGDSILLPQPAFSLYTTICGNKGFVPKYYNLLAERKWEADLDQMDQIIDETTKAILITNPSNPCGSVYTEEHLRGILAVAEKHKIPIVADEIYADMAFGEVPFYFISSLTTTVPVISVGGLAKQYVVPGWRLGWILINDRNGLFAEVRKGLEALSTLIMGPSSLIQGALPKLLHETEPEFYTNLNALLKKHAELISNTLKGAPGLYTVEPGGAMYLMVGIEMAKFPQFKDDVEFSNALLNEENVFVLPGQIFQIANFFRIVTTQAEDQLVEACQRITEFATRHAKA